MRILHYQRDMNLKGGGVVRFVLDVCAAVAARGHEVTVASPDVSDLPGSWKAGGAGLPRVLQVPVPRGPLDSWSGDARPAVRDAVASADVVHIHGTWRLTNVQLGRAALRAGVPYVITPHGMLDEWCVAQGPFKRRLFHALAGRGYFDRATLVHCTAQGEIDQSRRWFPETPTAVVPPVLDLDLFKVMPGPSAAREAFKPALEGAPVVLFLSRVHPQKSPEILIDAVALLKDRSVACNLFIAGPGEPEYLDALRRRAEERGVGDRTRFPGMVSGTLKVSLYQLATVFALPSPQESFGLVFCEAMACGTPVVARKGIDIWPELEAAKAAVLSEGTPGAFAEVLGRLLGNEAERRVLAAAGRRWLAEYLDPGRVAVQYEAMYEGIRRR